MTGTRDTEIAVGAWQPNFSIDNPHGDIHIFRLALFSEHFNHFEEIFKYPSDIGCVQRVKDMLRYNWAIYTGQLQTLKEISGIKGISGNMLPYPIEINPDGSLAALHGMEHFPDFPPEASIKGKVCTTLPQSVTA